MTTVESGPMPQAKKAISLTLSVANIEAIKAIAASMEFPPSISEIVDKAVTEYIERWGKSDAARRKPKP